MSTSPDPYRVVLQSGELLELGTAPVNTGDSSRRRALDARTPAVLALLLISALLRLYRLDSWPPGLAGDTAYNGLDILQVLEGHRPLFFSNNHGREALFIYFQAALVALAGRQPIVLAFSSVIMSMLAIAVAYRLFQALFGWRPALIGAALLSFSFWSLSFSRIGLRTTMVAPLLGTTLYLLYRTLRANHWRYGALAGLTLGLSLYTYISARLIPVLVVLICLVEWRLARRRLAQLALLVLTSALVFAPEGLYFLQHQRDFTQRAQEVSVFNPHPDIVGTPSTPERSILLTLGMFFVDGDQNRQHNLPGEPVFPAWLAVLFVAGLVQAAYRIRGQPVFGWPLLWLALMLVPSALSHSAPDMLQSLAAAPAAYLFPALALEALLAWPGVRRARYLFAAGAVLVFGVQETNRYFNEWAGNPRTQALFAVADKRLAALVNAQPETKAYVAFQFDDTLPAFRYAQKPLLVVGWFPGESNFVPLPRPPKDVLYVAATSAALNQNGPSWVPGLVPIGSTDDTLGQPAFSVFRLPAKAVTDLMRTQRSLDTPLGSDFRLVSYEAVSPPRQLVVNLLWQSLQPKGPYDLNIHLIDGNGQLAGQSDRAVWPVEHLIGAASHAPDSALATTDDLMLTQHTFEANPGNYVLEVGAVHLSIKAPWLAGEAVGGPIGEVVRIPITIN